MNTISLFVLGFPIMQVATVAIVAYLSGHAKTRAFEYKANHCVRLSRIEAASKDPDCDRAKELALGEAILALKEASRLRARNLDSSALETHWLKVVP